MRIMIKTKIMRIIIKIAKVMIIEFVIKKIIVIMLLLIKIRKKRSTQTLKR